LCLTQSRSAAKVFYQAGSGLKSQEPTGSWVSKVKRERKKVKGGYCFKYLNLKSNRWLSGVEARDVG
jgi:hypothetical protein